MLVWVATELVITWMYPALFMSTPVDRHLGCSQSLMLRIILVKCPLSEHVHAFLLGRPLGVELLGKRYVFLLQAGSQNY